VDEKDPQVEGCCLARSPGPVAVHAHPLSGSLDNLQTYATSINSPIGVLSEYHLRTYL
jgi:hypothetical protein